MPNTVKKKISAKDLLNKVRNPIVKQDTPKKPTLPVKVPKVDHGKVVNYYVEYEDGTALLAQGKHAHLIYRFTMEAQQLATMHAFAYYEGPGMPEMTKDEALRLLVFKEAKDV